MYNTCTKIKHKNIIHIHTNKLEDLSIQVKTVVRIVDFPDPGTPVKITILFCSEVKFSHKIQLF